METLNAWSFLASHGCQREELSHPQLDEGLLFESLPPQTQMVLEQQLQKSQPEEGAVADPHMEELEGLMAMKEENLLEREEANTGDLNFGEAMAMEELEARMGEYMSMGLEDMLAPGGLGVVPVSIGAFGDPDAQHEGPDLDPGGEHMGSGEEPPTELEMESWSFVADGEKESAMDRTLLAPVMDPQVLLPGELPPEPPPPAQVRRMLADRMREMGRGLMIAGSKAPRQQMMEIQETMMGLLNQLEALADQPGREALRRRILLQMRPRVMRF